MLILRQLALVAALATLLTGCLPQAPGAESSGQEDSDQTVDTAGEEVVEVLEPEPEPEPQPVLTQEDMDQALEEVMAENTAAAVSVATIEHGQLSQSGAWGWAIKNEREMTPDTKIRIASISKVAVGMCALAMAEEGLLDLEAPLSTYWGEGAVNPYSQTQPNVQDVMTHTSSLKDLNTTSGLSTLRNLLNSGSSWRSMEPGNGGYWYYSNFGFCVLGTTLELAADQVLDDYFHAKFLDPMGIRASFYSGKMEADEIATLYTTGGVGRSAAEAAGFSVPTSIGGGAAYYPGGLTISSVDMARLVSILINDGMYEGAQYLSPESVADMETPRFTVDPGESGTPFEQCLVLRRQEDILGQDVLYYHTGSAYGVFSLMSYNPETGNGVVVITTGAPRQTEEHGLYALCAALSEKLYAKMEDGMV